MTPDEQVTIYNKGVQEGMKHTKPSPETERRLNKLEKVVTDVSTSLAVFIQETKDYHNNQDTKLEKILDQTTKHNGRMTKIELWKAGLDGGAKATMGIWAFMSVFIIAATFGIFQMYITVQELSSIVAREHGTTR